MGKVLFLAVITAFLFGIAAPVMAEEHAVESEGTEAVSPGILPTNPYYFVKKFGWGLRRFFAFDPVKKLELELERLDELAAETRKMSMLEADAALIESELENYKSGLDALR